LTVSNRVADIVRTLEPEDWTALYSIERFLSSKEVVQLKQIERVTGFTQDKATFHLNRLNSFGLVIHKKGGFSLVSKGLDVIALYALAKRDVVVEVGPQLGVGKEADVFEAKDARGEVRALKFYRVGRTSFRAVIRNRAYAQKPEGHRWLHLNVLAARREFECLKQLSTLHISVPRVFARERHALVMQLIRGVLLSKRPKLNAPKKSLIGIIEILRVAYLRRGIINADLSEFNILYDGEGCWVLDWPQAIKSTHPNASDLLNRDVQNIVRFFEKTYNIRTDWHKLAQYVTGERVSNLHH
jgi:RIO kinase 2